MLFSKGLQLHQRACKLSMIIRAALNRQLMVGKLYIHHFVACATQLNHRGCRDHVQDQLLCLPFIRVDPVTNSGPTTATMGWSASGEITALIASSQW